MRLSFNKLQSVTILIALTIVISISINGYSQDTFFISEFKKFIEPFDPYDEPLKDVNIRETGVSGTIALKGNEDGTFRHVIFIHGSKHTFWGKCEFFDHLFESDKDDPLQFKVDKDKGYVYIKGKGTVTMSDGKVVKLPIR